MGTWTTNDDGDWVEDKPELDRDDQLRKDWEKLKREEEDYIRRHQTPDLQIIPVEHEEEKPRTPTPADIQKIIDDIDSPDTPTPPARKPYVH